MKKTLLILLLCSVSATISQATFSLRNRATLAVLPPSPPTTLNSLPNDVGIGSIPRPEFEIYHPLIQPPVNCTTFIVSTIQNMYFANNYLNYGITNAFSIPYVVSPRLLPTDSLPRLQFNIGMNTNLSAGTYVDTLVILGTRQNVCNPNIPINFSARYLFTVTSTIVSGLELIDVKYEEVSLFPNPAGAILNIHNLPSSSNLKFYAITGELIKEVDTEQTLISVDLSTFQNGCYFILFTDRNKIYRREKFIVAR